jgi:hypothetical protein
MKYCFCTIAIGEKYLNSAINFAQKLNEKSTGHHMVIVTDDMTKTIPNTTFIEILKTETLFIHNFFNYNLKYFPIKHSKDLGFDYIIFVDSDWGIIDDYNEESIIKMLDFMSNRNYDFLFERPHPIGNGKHDGIQSFWRHKIDFYKLLETDIYDKGHVVNEQFLVFKNNEKLQIFINEWERLTNIATEGNLWAFAEGVEIGMSSALADMTYDYTEWKNYLRNFFTFTTIDGKTYNRF